MQVFLKSREFRVYNPETSFIVAGKAFKSSGWKAYLRGEAARSWSGSVITSGDLQMTLVYLCELSPPNIDNIVKPIQDALVGLIFADDALIADVDSHRRFLNGTFNLTQLPPPITAGIASEHECVYVRVSDSLPLEEYV